MADPNIQELKFSVTDPTFGTTLGIPIVRNWRLDVKKTGSDAGSYVLYDTSFGSGNPPILRSDKVQSGTDANGNPQYVWKTSVVDSYKSTYDRLEENQKRFLFDTMTKNSDKKRADFINDSYTQTQRNDLFRDIPGVKNVATTPDGRVIPPGTSPTGLANIPPAEASESSPTSPRQNGERPQETITSEDLDISQIRADDSEEGKWWYGIDPLIYPRDISKNKQDYIVFNIFEYVTRGINQTSPLLIEGRTLPRDSKISIILPIQPSITDTNTVDWNSSSLNPVEMGLYSLADAGMNPERQRENILGKMGNAITQDQNAEKAILLYLKQKAIGTTGLVSRFGGAVVNPNMELLFQGPQLRPFNFSFRLSPRDDGEAKIVKTIIRVFKEAMAVRTASNGIFLAAPHIFNISYKNGALNKEHTSLNKIKTCALQSCSVDYTPDGSYMTFDDTTNGNPMTSYNLTLQFQELEPVTDRDYSRPTNLEDEIEIGY